MTGVPLEVESGDGGWRVSSGVLVRFTALLGDDVFFVPCEWGTKKPLVTYVERPFESTKTEAYRAVFSVQEVNVAVYLGAASGGLCAIDFDSDADLSAFLAVNPKLAQTTQSRGSRGGMLWVRVARGQESVISNRSPVISGLTTEESRAGNDQSLVTSAATNAWPASCNAEHFEWRADKRLSTIYGLHPQGMEYRLVCESPPIVLAFSEIVWPDGWELPWQDTGDAKLRQLYGEPFYMNEKGGLSGINEAYWAGMHATENEVLFEPDEKGFYAYSAETGLYEIESADVIRHKISSRMLRSE